MCLVLYTIVISRMNRQTNVIFGGVDGAYVSSDSVTFLDPNATEENARADGGHLAGYRHNAGHIFHSER